MPRMKRPCHFLFVVFITLEIWIVCTFALVVFAPGTRQMMSGSVFWNLPPIFKVWLTQIVDVTTKNKQLKNVQCTKHPFMSSQQTCSPAEVTLSGTWTTMGYLYMILYIGYDANTILHIVAELYSKIGVSSHQCEWPGKIKVWS